ncbi:hypothetical protein N7516_011483 [Penicillium verrucosum]|uniref:uncharacterized protein n=1 Tax=Penicillium verrucosum TaxID=60171 RepID=UPI002545303C|nr:uncharacterized protein N7516_011483 [Penicillium verrucosum]KAJ5920625.1 hypothetical protein N7516_011483 [Penicillium verrucosum]
MFISVPSLIDPVSSSNEWPVLAKPLDAVGDFILDTHFMGITPLNDYEPSKHTFDCIAISGLASHPFGSWQPKEGNKTFMWIRDELPDALPGARALIYGYDTKLHDSQSFQLIPDLAIAFVNQLETLGGLVLKEALVRLASNNAYKRLLSNIKGAVFFGVPSLGMEQQHFHTVVGNNPNQNLVDDLARGSNYLNQLHKHFEDSYITDTIQCFWAYETLQSPTIRSNPSVTFPINSTHSDMVKFTRGSPLSDVVISKLSSILSSPKDEGCVYGRSTGCDQLPRIASTPPTPAYQDTIRDTFKGITEIEEADFKTMSLDELHKFLRSMQGEQEQSNEGLQNMNRLDSFLTSVTQYTMVTGDFLVFSDFEYFIWGPVKYVLRPQRCQTHTTQF